MEYLLGLRAALACVVLGAGLWAPHVAGAAIISFAVGSVLYLILAALAEWLRRHMGGRGLWSINGMLMADGIYLAWVVYLSGGTNSPLRFLVYVHIVAVSLLASYRTGLKLALWHTLLFFVVLYAQAGGLVDAREGGLSALPGRTGFGTVAMLNVTALWGMALGTAVFSSLVGRELRRQKVDLQELAAMVAELDRRMKSVDVAEILLDRLRECFGFFRAVLLASPDGALSLVAHRGAQELAGNGTSIDRVIQRAWDSREVVLVKQLDPQHDHLLAQLLPEARNLLVVPLFTEGQPTGIVALEHLNRRVRIRRWTVSMVQQFVSHGALALRNSWLLEEVQRMAETDPLTGLANRRVFQTALDREVARAERTGTQVSLLMLDADHFKAYNDRFGHRAGDELLRSLARALAEHSRAFDIVARYGGEEFAVILPECPVREAENVAERLRSIASGIDGLAPVTMSGGVATLPVHAQDATALVEAADVALYEAKRAGRDRLCLARSPWGEGQDVALHSGI
jgi:diguanylate cyclase (GGDEF)-like protein